MMTLITGFACPPTIYFKFIIIKSEVLLQSPTAFFITKCDGLLLQSAPAFLLQSFYYKCCYKVRRILQSVTILLQNVTIITKCDSTWAECIF